MKDQGMLKRFSTLSYKIFTCLTNFRQMIDRYCFFGMIGLLIIISSLSPLCFGTRLVPLKQRLAHLNTIEADSF